MSKLNPIYHWLRSLVVLPGAVLPLLPSVTCPVCLAAYAGTFSALGVGVLFSAQVQLKLILAFLALGMVSMALSTRNHRRPGPIVLTLAGSAAVVIGRVIWIMPPVVYAGVLLLIGASLWNLFLKRTRSDSLTQLRAD